MKGISVVMRSMRFDKKSNQQMSASPRTESVSVAGRASLFAGEGDAALATRGRGCGHRCLLLLISIF